jgi:hypothetical protein
VAENYRKTRAAVVRRQELAQLLGIREAEAADRTLSGRLKILAKLKAARKVEIARGRSGSWLYDVNRHLNLCASLRLEYEALAEYFAQGATDAGSAPAGDANPAPAKAAAPRKRRAQKGAVQV